MVSNVRPETVQDEFSESGSGMDLTMLWRHKSLVVLGTVVGLVIGSIYYSRSEPVYQSQARLLLIKKGPAPSAGGSNAVMSYVEDYLSAHLSLLRSPLVVRQAANDAGLAKLPSFTGSTDPTDSIIGALRVEADSDNRSTNLVDLSFHGPRAQDCQAVLESIIESYQSFLDETYQDANQDTLQLITVKAQELKAELQEMETEYHAFRRGAPLLWKDSGETSFYEDRLSTIESSRSQLQIRRAQLQPRLKMLEQDIRNGREAGALLALIGQWQSKDAEESSLAMGENAAPNVKRGEESLLPLLLEESALLKTYGSQHPQLVSVRHRIQFMRNHFAATHSSTTPKTASEQVQYYVQSLEQQLQDIERSEESLSELFQQEHELAKGLIDFDLKEKHLRTDIARTEQFYEGLLGQLQGLDLSQDFGGFTATVIRPPNLGSRIAPNAASIFAVALLLGTLGGLGLAYLAEQTDKRFRTPEEIRRHLGVSIVGRIPQIRPAKLAHLNGEARYDAHLCSYHRPKSVEAEAFRGIRTALYFGTGGKTHKVIQLTSAMQGDGKSTAAANIAISIAKSGQKCLLIDADMRCPRVHSMFGIQSETGLSAVLTDESEMDDAIVDSQIANLSLLPAGPIPSNPAELLTSVRLKELLEVLRQRYDFVVVDTPPMLAVSDPCMVASAVDGVLLTVRIGKNRRYETEQAQEMLSELDATLLGVVVNGMDGGTTMQGYGYGKRGYLDDNGYYASEAEQAGTEILARHEDTVPNHADRQDLVR